MDTQSNDDSLDKSLQQKCVVEDDLGTGDESSLQSMCSESDLVGGLKTEDCAMDIAHQQKTESNQNVISDDGSSGDSVVVSNIVEGICSRDSSDDALQFSENSTNLNAFETTVKQISKDLKETTLAETESESDAPTPVNAPTPITSTSSSSSSLSTTPDDDNCTIDNGSQSVDDMDGEGGAGSNSLQDMCDEYDEQDGRSKKVRFHPDCKENDGGSRMKKKKRTLLDGVETECDMELDEDEPVEIAAADAEPEEVFDLAKTIAEAEDYLKQHPLTFVRPNENTGERLKNGLLDVDDVPQLAESSEDEDVYANVMPENGVTRVLGKQTKSGTIEFLLRFNNRSGLHWEPQQYLQTHCPTLLSLYEKKRERQQERLMRHVARRQNLRQRYTDF